jgi:hypothetical protein
MRDRPMTTDIARLRELERERDEARELLRLGRHAFDNLNRHGKTILDMFNVWLDQYEDRAKKAEAAADTTRAQVAGMRTALEACEARFREYVAHHVANSSFAKASRNADMVTLIITALSPTPAGKA